MTAGELRRMLCSFRKHSRDSWYLERGGGGGGEGGEGERGGRGEERQAGRQNGSEEGRKWEGRK